MLERIGQKIDDATTPEAMAKARADLERSRQPMRHAMAKLRAVLRLLWQTERDRLRRGWCRLFGKDLEQ